MRGDRNLRRLVLAHGISRLGGSAGFFIGLWGTAAFELEATPFQLSLLMGTTGVASMLGAAIAGVLVDRWDPRRVLMLGELLFAPSILLLTQARDLTTLTVLAAVAWIAHALPFTAMNSFPPALSDDERLIERANVGLEAGGTIAFILGPAVGALLVRLTNTDAVFVLDAVTSLAAVWIMRHVTVGQAPARERRRGISELAEGFSYAFRRPPLRMVLVLGTMTWLSFGAFSALEPLFFRDVVGTGVEAMGLMNSLFGIGMAGGTLVLHRMEGRLTSLRALAVLTSAGGIGAIAYTGTASLAVIAVGALYWGVVLGMVLPLLRTLAHLHTRPGLVGRVMSVFLIQHNVGELLPLAIAPALALAIGVQRSLWAAGVVLIVGGLVALPRARSLDGAPVVGTEPDTTPGPLPLPELPEPAPPLA